LKPFNPKPRSCPACGKNYTPTRPMQSVCSPRCAVRKIKQDKAEERAKTVTRRAALRTKGQRKAAAQKAINWWVVHVRDKDLPCISCGRIHDGVWHAGHYRSRGSAPHLALDPRNLAKQCAPCNLYLHGNLIEYRLGLIKRHGVEFVEVLEADDAPRRYSDDELDAIAAHYRAKAKELRKA